MQKLIFLFSLTLALVSCEKDKVCSCVKEDLPLCIQEMIADSTITAGLQTIQRTTVNGEYHFWLNSGASAMDGAEYIVNSQCDTICYWLCFCPPAPCSSDYDMGNFEVVWQK